MGPAETKLLKARLNTDFLAWLEGTADRLPRLERLSSIKPRTFVNAILAAAWIGGREPTPITADPTDWGARYGLLEQFLFAALKQNMWMRRQRRQDDLACLEETIQELLPESTARQFVREIREVGREQSVRVPRQPSRRKGGPLESEETRRMRAAVEYLKPASDRPYRDLADFWNERTKKNYDANQIFSRLRRGTVGDGTVSLEFWQDVYACKLWRVFPGPFPLSPELSMLCRETRPSDEELDKMVRLMVEAAPECEEKLREAVDCLRRRPRVNSDRSPTVR